jgi:valine--pyruvate aminotransferase
MNFSQFARAFAADAGILQLMDDLGEALAGDADLCMLGGGNPARIPEAQRMFREQMARILADGDRFESIVGNYDGPQGRLEFLEALAALLERELGWDVGPANVAVTNGSQSSFYVLFNLFSGPCDDGVERRVLLPLTPEYIGYSETGLGRSIFRSIRPSIELLDDWTFKYRVDFANVQVGDDIGAVCVSRPTNPTGNVLDDGEIATLRALARDRDVPLIIDSAYGMPFPGIVFNDGATPIWDDGVIVCMSLSKLGLPGVRTGIVVANERIIRTMTAANAILNLAPGSFGPALVTDMLRDGSILDLSNRVIRPFYEKGAAIAVDCLKEAFPGDMVRIHRPEGAFFLWLWIPDLPITSQELYQRLKRRGVLVIPGEHFFPGLEEDWPHRHECIRVSYAQEADVVRRGFRIIAEEVDIAFAGARAERA